MATLSLNFLRNYRLGTYRESEPVAYQYDQGHVLDILVPGAVASAEVQYWTRGMKEAAAYEVGSITQQSDGSYAIECSVPNEFFGTWGDLRVYLVVTDDSKYVVTYEGRIKVLQREKPEDYVDDDPDNEALRILIEAREAAQTATAAADRAEEVEESIPADYTALSREVTQLNERLDDVEEDLSTLEADLEGDTTEKQIEIDFTYDYYINIRDNTVIPINNPIADNRYKYAIVNCSEGDVFLINAYGGGAPRAYCFIDASNTKLLASGPDENILNTKITAPANSAKVIIQDRYYDPNGYEFGDLPSYRIIETQGIGNNFVRFDKAQDKTDAEKAIARENIGLDELPDGLSDDVKESLLACFAHVVWVDEHGPDYYEALEEALYADTIKYGVYVPKKTINGQYIDEYGEIQNGTVGESFYIDDYIPVVRHNYWIGMNPASLRIQLPPGVTVNESNWRISEYDEAKNFIKQTHFDSSHELCTSTLYAFDANTKYMRLGWYDSNSSTNDKAFDIENPSEITVLPVEVGNIDASTGANAESTTRIRTVGYIPVSDTITVTGCPFYDSWSDWVSLWTSAGYSEQSFFYAIRCYDSNKEYLGGLTYEGANVFRQDISNIPLLNGTAYVRFILQTENHAALSITLSNHLITINGTKYYLAKNA